jgi:hypothetical protein
VEIGPAAVRSSAVARSSGGNVAAPQIECVAGCDRHGNGSIDQRGYRLSGQLSEERVPDATRAAATVVRRAPLPSSERSPGANRIVRPAEAFEARRMTRRQFTDQGDESSPQSVDTRSRLGRRYAGSIASERTVPQIGACTGLVGEFVVTMASGHGASTPRVVPFRTLPTTPMILVVGRRTSKKVLQE